MQLLDLKYGAFGLDINDLCVKILKLEKRGGKFAVASYGKQNLEPGIVENGIIKNEKAVVAAIKSAHKNVNGKKIKAKHAVVSLPEDESFLQVIQLPKMSREEVKSAVIYEAENHIPISIKEVYLDFQIIVPIKNDLDHVDVLLAAAPKHLVDAYISCVKASGFIPLAIELESQSLVRALVKDEISEYPVVIININKSNIDFVVFSGRSIRFTCSIPTPKIQLAESQTIILDSAGVPVPVKNNAENISLNLEELALQIKKYISFYQQHTSHEHLLVDSAVKKVLLCGEKNIIESLPEFIKQEVGIQTEIANPFINAPLPKNKSLNDVFLSYASAIGLTLGGINIEKEN